MDALEPRILIGHVLEQLATLPDESVHCVVTSPPYWALRDYGTGTWDGGDLTCDHTRSIARRDHTRGVPLGTRGEQGHTAASALPGLQECARCGATRVDQQLGLESSPEEYIDRMVAVFREVRRVLRSDGSLWLNIGDSYASKTRGSDNGWDKSRLSNPGYVQKAQAASLRSTGERHRGKEAGLKEKDLVGIPWSLAFALRDDGWWLRRDNIWSKRNPMPESTSDRTTSAHEYMFMLTKAPRYFYDADAVREEAAWERWGTQTSPKHGENGQSRANWIKTKAPDGWDTSRGGGGHGSVHREGRAKGVPAEVSARGRNKRSVWEIAEEQEDAAAWLADLFLEAMRAGDGRLSDTVWSIATQPYAQAHFATFPTKLVEPCVMAGTSERGVCPDCAAPWERVVSIEYERAHGHGEHSKTGRRRDMRRRTTTSNEDGGGGLPRLDKLVETTGWRPMCACYDDLYRVRTPRPRASKRWQNMTWWERARARAGDPSWPTVAATVLDPFSGAATTLLVARRLNRASVGVELNPEYAELGRRRLERWWAKPPRVTPPPLAGQLELLALTPEGGTDA